MRIAHSFLFLLLAFGKVAAQAEVFDPETRLAEQGIALPVPTAPIASYVHAVRVGNLLFLSGKGPALPGGGYVGGRVGTDLTVEQGYEAARLTAIHQLAVLKAELGDLRRVKRIVKVLGMVQCDAAFGQQPEVVNGFSDLMVQVFGERGRHARSAIGTVALPRGMCVEVELVVEIEE